MPVTAADVRNVAFSKPPIGKRGYHEDEVDAFLDVVGAELARLIRRTTISAIGLRSSSSGSAPHRSTPDLPFARRSHLGR